MAGANAALTACWIVGTVRKFVRRYAMGALTSDEQVAYFLVDADVGSAEPVD